MRIELSPFQSRFGYIALIFVAASPGPATALFTCDENNDRVMNSGGSSRCHYNYEDRAIDMLRDGGCRQCTGNCTECSYTYGRKDVQCVDLSGYCVASTGPDADALNAAMWKGGRSPTLDGPRGDYNNLWYHAPGWSCPSETTIWSDRAEDPGLLAAAVHAATGHSVEIYSDNSSPWYLQLRNCAANIGHLNCLLPPSQGQVSCACTTCSNHGTCTSGVDTYTCKCDNGYAGIDCETATSTTTTTTTTNTSVTSTTTTTTTSTASTTTGTTPPPPPLLFTCTRDCVPCNYFLSIDCCEGDDDDKKCLMGSNRQQDSPAVQALNEIMNAQGVATAKVECSRDRRNIADFGWQDSAVCGDAASLLSNLTRVALSCDSIERIHSTDGTEGSCIAAANELNSLIVATTPSTTTITSTTTTSTTSSTTTATTTSTTSTTITLSTTTTIKSARTTITITTKTSPTRASRTSSTATISTSTTTAATTGTSSLNSIASQTTKSGGTAAALGAVAVLLVVAVCAARYYQKR